MWIIDINGECGLDEFDRHQNTREKKQGQDKTMHKEQPLEDRS